MAGTMGKEHVEFLEELSRAIAEWEGSPYYLPEEELFDLERFLVDHQAMELKDELERTYGIPLNQKFWSSSLVYHRLKRAREQIKTQEVSQEERRQIFLQTAEEEKKTRQKWLKDWFHHHQRLKMKVLPGGKRDLPA